MSLFVSQSGAHLSERDQDFQVNLKMFPHYVYSCLLTLASAIKLPPYNMQMISPLSLKGTILKIHVHFHGDKLAQPEPACFRMWTHTILSILFQLRFFSHRIVKQLLSYPPVSNHSWDVDQVHSAIYSHLSGSALCKRETETAFKRNLLRTTACVCFSCPAFSH